MSGCLCAICYEDVLPASELLQSISVCGHVFHELCLQQWIEYCPNGRTPTCPLCKQNCAARDAHRLYFQSSTESAGKQDAANASSKSPPSNEGTSEVDRAQIRKLEAKVRMLTSACELSNKQIVELTGKEAKNLEKLQSLEADRLTMKKEKAHLVEAFARTREELRRSSEHCRELLEKNMMMEKDLAVHQLVGDVDLSEADMVRLATLSSGTNKDDIIDSMTKSLHLRNRAFKELMGKCQELGMRETRAQKKSEKLIEQIKSLKARMQEMAKAQEEQENASLRSLTSVQPLRCASEIARKPFAACNGRILVSEKNYCVSPSKPLKEASRTCSPRSPTVIHLDCEENVRDEIVSATQSSKGELDSARRYVEDPSECVADYLKIQNTWGHSSLVRNKELRNPEGAMDLGAHGSCAGTLMQDTGSNSRLRTYVEAPSAPCERGYDNEQHPRNQSERPRLIIGLEEDIDNMEVQGCSIQTIRREKGLGQGASYVQPQSLIGGERCAPPVAPPKFIVSGANGRGGRITILKPPQGGSTSVVGVNRAKRLKSTTHIAGRMPAALKIEHFFGRG